LELLRLRRPKGKYPQNKSKDGDLSEDAYWEQYASIQGTADSTVPTPKRETRDEETFDEALARARGLHDNVELEMYDHSTEDIIDIPYNSLNIPPPCHNPAIDPRDASCPTDLSDRLRALSPSPPTNAESLPSVNGMDGKTNGHSNGKVNGKLNDVNGVVDGESRSTSLTPQHPVKPLDEATKRTIRGVYEMWKLAASGMAHEDEFLHLVTEAISS